LRQFTICIWLRVFAAAIPRHSRPFSVYVDQVMDFVDQAEILVKAGDGGAGCISFRREKYVPRGGPDGGDGGRGGNVYLVVDSGLNTLQSFRYKRTFKAQKGRPGRGKNQHGKAGEDMYIKVPPGTLVKDAETGLVLADLTEPGEPWLAARGGKGGKGNARFATSTRQAPRYAQPGTKGQERRLLLELKLLADVGLIGFPNAGKSTLLSRISSARPKIADYPFTTLIPQLGVVELSDHRTMVVADIPGLIEGAHKGVGMGLDFLRHVERTSVLLYILDCSLAQNEIVRDLKVLQSEIEAYHAPLLKKPQIIALNKIDIVDNERLESVKEALSPCGLELFPISAATGKGVQALLEALYAIVEKERQNQLDLTGQDIDLWDLEIVE